MKTFDLFFPDLLPNTPGCNEPAAEHALLRASQHFCVKTFAWRVTLDPIATEADTDEYELDFPDRGELVRIEGAKFNGRDIDVAMPNARPGRHHDFIECLDGKNLTMNPVPKATGELVLRVTLKPGNKSLGVPDFMFDRHAEVIAKGAEGILKMQAQKPYTSADGPAVWQRFEDQCASLKLALWRGLARNRARTKPVFF